MTYRDALKASMSYLSCDPRTRFIGYGLKHGKAAGSLANVPADQICEFPVAEGLMTSAAIGMSLTGLLPLVYFERMDFLLNAADAVVNHLNAMATISRGEFKPAVILRCVVGNRTKPLFTGETHTQDFSEAFTRLVSFPVVRLTNAEAIAGVYGSARAAQLRGESSMIVEYKDLI
jgi:pyruvate/2-oxoglutarate/acetoin dehydrogenase E1 component